MSRRSERAGKRSSAAEIIMHISSQRPNETGHLIEGRLETLRSKPIHRGSSEIVVALGLLKALDAAYIAYRYRQAIRVYDAASTPTVSCQEPIWCLISR